MGLRCAQAHVILEFISGMKNPKAIDSKRGQRNGTGALVISENGGEISSEELCHVGPCVPIGVDIFKMSDKRYGTGIHRVSKFSAGNLFASSFLWKAENPPHL